MPFSHHSHSGQFCGHGADTLAEVLHQAVVRRKMSVFGLTEHCPRSSEDLYPEEKGHHSSQTLEALFDEFIVEALRLRQSAATNTSESHQSLRASHILIGFEAEWIRPVESTSIVRRILDKHAASIDYFIGSVHHVKTIPIDFDVTMYQRARVACGGSDADLFVAYFEAQLEMLQTLKPQVVGHFDLIRLYSDTPDADLRQVAGGAVWLKIARNLKAAKEIGALLEINTSAWRKGLAQPYPCLEVCQAWIAMGGQFVLSDDSHCVGHVGTNYERLLPWLDELGVDSIAHFSRDTTTGVLHVKAVDMDHVRNHAFWTSR